MCNTPISLKHDEAEHGYYSVPCGKCPKCIARRVSGWSFRLLREGIHAETAYFITLTYDTEHVPLTKKGFMALNKGHVQKFIKDLRRSHTGDKRGNIKYFAVGEYGSIKYRPHYHIILFNAMPELMVTNAEHKILEYTNWDGKYHVKVKQWTHGTTTFGKVEGASIGYCFKYLSKPSRIPLHKNDDRPREWSLMSKGLGKNYLTPEMIAWHKADLDNRMYINLPQGQKASMPRYYKDKIYTEVERLCIANTFQQKMQNEETEYYNNYDPQKEYEKALSIKAAFNRMQHRANKLQGTSGTN